MVPYLRFTSKQDRPHSWDLPTRYTCVHSTLRLASSWHHQKHSNSSITNTKMCYITTHRTIRQRFISSGLPDLPPYVILLDSGTNVEQSYDDLIQAGRDDTSPSKSTNNAANLEGTPHFLCYDSKVTMDHKGSFHKKDMNYSSEFSF